MRTVICDDSGTSRWEDEFISKQASNLEWPHKPHRPTRLWSARHFCHMKFSLNLSRVSPRLLPWPSLPQHGYEAKRISSLA